MGASTAIENRLPFVIAATVLAGLGTICLLAGDVCPYWAGATYSTSANVSIGPFLCIGAINTTKLVSCSLSILTSLNFNTTAGKTSYTIAQAFDIVATIAGGISIVFLCQLTFSCVRFVAIKFRKVTLLITLAVLSLAAVCALVGLAIFYFGFVRSEGQQSSLSGSSQVIACGAVFGVGCLCFLIAIILLIAYWLLTQNDPSMLIGPTLPIKISTPIPQTPPSPTQPFNAKPDDIYYQKVRPKPQNSSTPPPSSLATKKDFKNPYGYTGDPYTDSQLHWLHSFYHNYAYGRPTYPFGPPANLQHPSTIPITRRWPQQQ